MSAEDWLFKSDAMDVGRRLHPELSDEALWRMLEDAAGPPPETITRPDGSREITKTFEHPSGVWPVRTRPKAVPGSYSHALAYFSHDVQRLYAIAFESKPAKPAPPPAKQVSASNIRELIVLFKEAARKTPDGYLTQKHATDLAGSKFTRVQIRKAMCDAGVATNKPGRRSINSQPKA